MNELEERRMVARAEERRELAKAVLLKLLESPSPLFPHAAADSAVRRADALLERLDQPVEQP